MNKPTLLLSISLLMLGGYACDSQPAAKAPAPVAPVAPVAKVPAPAAPVAPDNTERNVRDRSGETLTPGDQSTSEADLALTQQIRQAVVADTSLSTNAHNVKIITSNGVVTLRGPVNSPQEKATIDAKAQQIAGATKVKNELEIVAN
jgi:hyperosmotically inducible periplasmic protein